MDGTEGFSSNDVARLCGVTLRQLQWWDEKNVVCPRQDGHKRIYLIEEAIAVAIVADLRRKGISLQAIRRVLRASQKEMSGRLDKLLTSGGDTYLVANGKQARWVSSADEVVALFRKATQPMFLVCVSDQARRLAGAVERTPARFPIARAVAETDVDVRVA